jgi:hypothetical protein
MLSPHSKGVMALGLNIFFTKNLPKPLGDFVETWYREISQCVDVHYTREILSPNVRSKSWR